MHSEDELFIPGFSTQTLCFCTPDSKTYGVTWRTDIETPSPAVELSSEDEDFEKRIIPAVTEISPVGGFVHKAKIDGLLPDTEYTYRVGDSEKDVWHSYSYFRTREENPDDFDFLYICDSQTNSDRGWEPLRKALLSADRKVKNHRFAVHGGDFVQYGSVEPHWREMIDESGDFFRHTPVMPASGNHEIVNGGRPFVTREHFNYSLPCEQNDKTGDFYSFDYGNLLHIAVLNTNSVEEDQSMKKGQVEWLENDLRTSKARWKIVVQHFETFSRGQYGYLGNDGRRSHGFRRDLAPLYIKYGVDLVLQGHDHVFVRTHHIDENEKPVICKTEIRDFCGDKTEYHINPGYPIYYNSGAAGGNRGKLADSELVNDEYLYVKAERGVNCSYGTVHVNQSTLTLRTYMADGYDGDILYDSFGIEKD